MIRYQCESLSQAWGDGYIAARQHDEMSSMPGDFTPNLPLYEKLEQFGKLVIVTARESGKVVGYCAAVIGEHPNSIRPVRYGQTMLLYVLDTHRRRGLVGYNLVLRLRDELIKRDVKIIRVGYKPGFADLGRLLESLGFQLDEIFYSLKL